MKFDHIALTVNNLEESIKFYSDMFGFELTEQYEKDETQFAYLEKDEMRLELWQFEGMKENQDDLSDLTIKGIRHIGLEVENIEETIEELKNKGLEFPEPELGSSGRRYSLSTDPNGIAIELIEIKLI